MRFILVGVVWVVILTMVTVVFNVRSPQSEISPKLKSERKYPVSIEITTTFSTEKDPFSFGSDTGAFEIVLDGSSIYKTEDKLQDRVPVRTEAYMLAEGLHEVFVSGNPSDSTVSQAVRITINSEGHLLSDATYWFSAGETVSASHKFEIKSEEEAHDEH